MALQTPEASECCRTLDPRVEESAERPATRRWYRVLELEQPTALRAALPRVRFTDRVSAGGAALDRLAGRGGRHGQMAASFRRSFKIPPAVGGRARAGSHGGDGVRPVALGREDELIVRAVERRQRARPVDHDQPDPDALPGSPSRGTGARRPARPLRAPESPRARRTPRGALEIPRAAGPAPPRARAIRRRCP